MSTNLQIGKCYKCGSETELWYFDGGFFCKKCIRSFLDGGPLHDYFMLDEWIKKENKEMGKRSK